MLPGKAAGAFWTINWTIPKKNIVAEADIING